MVISPFVMTIDLVTCHTKHQLQLPDISHKLLAIPKAYPRHCLPILLFASLADYVIDIHLAATNLVLTSKMALWVLNSLVI